MQVQYMHTINMVITHMYPRLSSTLSFSLKKAKNTLAYPSLSWGLMLSRLTCRSPPKDYVKSSLIIEVCRTYNGEEKGGVERSFEC